MDKERKTAVIEEISAQLAEAGSIFAVDYRGIGVSEAAELRSRLREADASFRVVKNRLAKRAAESAGTTGLDSLLEGPTALTLIKGDPVVAAKAIADFAREHEVPTYKGGIMDGVALDPEQFQRIAKLPGMDVLRGQLVATVASPITGVTRGLNQLLAGLASQLGQIQDQGLVSGEAEPAAAADEAPAEDEAPAAEEPAAQEPAAEEKTEAEAAPEEQAEAAPEEPEATPEPEADAEETSSESEEASEDSGDQAEDNPPEPDASAEDSGGTDKED